MCLRLPQCAADEESNEIFICVCWTGQRGVQN